jgi:hypothetical protein
MIRMSLIFFVIIYQLSQSAQAQNIIRIDTLLAGTWKGNSICQAKNSPCHDETVVYHISKKQGLDSFSVNASKIVNGAEDEMGILPFFYNEKTKQFISEAYGTWTFSLEGNKLEGTLYVRGELYRKIKLYKTY